MDVRDSRPYPIPIPLFPVTFLMKVLFPAPVTPMTAMTMSPLTGTLVNMVSVEVGLASSDLVDDIRTEQG